MSDIAAEGKRVFPSVQVMEIPLSSTKGCGLIYDSKGRQHFLLSPLSCLSAKARWLYSFFCVKIIPMIEPIRIIDATLTNSHSNE